MSPNFQDLSVRCSDPTISEPFILQAYTCTEQPLHLHTCFLVSLSYMLDSPVVMLLSRTRVKTPSLALPSYEARRAQKGFPAYIKVLPLSFLISREAVGSFCPLAGYRRIMEVNIRQGPHLGGAGRKRKRRGRRYWGIE